MLRLRAPSRRVGRIALAAAFLGALGSSARAGDPLPASVLATARPLTSCKPCAGGSWAMTGANVVRNGTFDLATAAWATMGRWILPSDRAARDVGGTGLEVILAGPVAEQGHLVQEVYLPRSISELRFEMDWRLAGAGRGQAALTGLKVALATFDPAGGFRVVAPLLSVTPASYPGPAWHHLSVVLPAAARAAVQTLVAEGRGVFVQVGVAGADVALYVDNVALRVTGAHRLPPIPGVIAYLTRVDVLRTAIRAVAADGKHPVELLRATGSIYGLDWRSDGAALAFASTHEMAWSRFGADVYAVGKSGAVRRLTNPPSQADILRSKAPIGTVRGMVRNLARRQRTVTIYVEGARKLASVYLAPRGLAGAVARFEIHGVRDLGPGANQYVSAREAGESWVAANLVDVKPGGVSKLPGELLVGASGTNPTASDPSWRRDGKAVCFSAGGLRQVLATGGYGDPLFGGPGTVIGFHPRWSPVDDRVLYQGALGGLWLLAPEASQAKEVVPDPSKGAKPRDAVWLPDGSGIIYVADSADPSGAFSGADLFLREVGAGKTVRLTRLYREQAGHPTVSPDGRYVAFERTMANGGSGAGFRSVQQLWVMDLRRPSAQWPIVTAGSPSSPSWGRTP